MIASHVEMEVDGDEELQPEGETNLDYMGQHVQNLFELKKIFRWTSVKTSGWLSQSHH